MVCVPPEVPCSGSKNLYPGSERLASAVIRGGLHYNLELRWDGVPSLADAMRTLKEQAMCTPAPQWVRVVGGWTEFQFAERRVPTLEEINEAAPDTPVFVLHHYDRAMLNAAALRAVGYTKDTPDSAGGEIQRDRQRSSDRHAHSASECRNLYSTLAKGPVLAPEDQLTSTRHYMRELNRLGVTSVIDAGNGFQNYPDDYKVIEELHQRGQTTRFESRTTSSLNIRSTSWKTSRNGHLPHPSIKAIVTFVRTVPARCSSSPPPISRTCSNLALI